MDELINENVDFQTDDEFLEIFKDSRLFMPVVFRDVMPENGMIEERFGIEICYFPDVQGNAVPLFTDLNCLKEFLLKTHQ